MSRNVVLGLCLLVLMIFDTSSQICFKFAAEQAAPFEADIAWVVRVLSGGWVYGAVIGYLGAFVTWMTLLRSAPVGPAFAASHLEIVGVLIISAPLFGEVISPRQWLGAALIIAGVVALAIGEKSASDGHG